MLRLAMINASVIHGLVIGPPSFIVKASDLHPINGFDVLLKYVDDSYLLIGSRNISTATVESSHVSKWAANNNLRLNPLKTRKLIVFRTPRRKPDALTPPIISGVERVTSLWVFGVVISSDLGMSGHLKQVFSSCDSSFCSLRVLCCYGLPILQLQEVARATTVASLMYASPSWWGFTSAHDQEWIEQLITKLKWWGFLPMSAPTLANEADQCSDQQLFRTRTSGPCVWTSY